MHDRLVGDEASRLSPMLFTYPIASLPARSLPPSA